MNSIISDLKTRIECIGGCLSLWASTVYMDPFPATVDFTPIDEAMRIAKGLLDDPTRREVTRALHKVRGQLAEGVRLLTVREQSRVPNGPPNPITAYIIAHFVKMREDCEPDLRDAVVAIEAMPDAAKGKGTTAEAGDDYTGVNWYGTKYAFDIGNQAKSVKLLWEHFQKGELGLHEKTIGETIGSDNQDFRLAHVFRKHPAWGTMIVPGSKKGTFMLKIPGITE